VNLCQKTLRNVDVLARYGGEEFVILLPETDPEGALTTGDRLRKEIERMGINTSQGSQSVTVSMGVASFDKSDKKSTTVDDLIERADQALYEAKNAGRNCVRPWRDAKVDQD
jgi:two-component system cell cycle response regulator